MQYSVLESSHQFIYESWTAHLWLHGSYPLGWDGHTSFPPHQFFWAWEVRNVWPQPTNIINIITIIQHQMHMGSQDDRLHWCWGSFSMHQIWYYKRVWTKYLNEHVRFSYVDLDKSWWIPILGCDNQRLINVSGVAAKTGQSRIQQ